MELDFSEQLPSEMMQAVLERVVIRRLEIPLVRPYRLSFGTLEHFDTILCEVLINGRIFRGETTTLPGYSHETIQDAWAFSRLWAEKALGLPVGEALQRIHLAGAKDPFCSVALISALEGCHPALDRPEPGALEAVSALLESEPEKIGREAGELIQKGYGTLKLKIGLDMRDNLRRTAAALEAIPAQARLRLDANQCLTLEQAVDLWAGVDDPRIEYLEQPFPRGDWDSLRALGGRAGMRICLDESIFSFGDLESMSRIEHPFWVKLKLMKQGSVCQTVRMARWLQENGYPVILGNGVQSDLGSLQEYALYRHLGLDSAAELNGFAKQQASPLADRPLGMDRGRIVFNGVAAPGLDQDKLREFARESWEGSS